MSEHDGAIAAYKARMHLGPDYVAAWQLMTVMVALVGAKDWAIAERMTVEARQFDVSEHGDGFLYVRPWDMGSFTPVVFENPDIRGLDYCLAAFGDFSVYRCDLRIWEHARILALRQGEPLAIDDWAPAMALLEQTIPIPFADEDPRE